MGQSNSILRADDPVSSQLPDQASDMLLLLWLALTPLYRPTQFFPNATCGGPRLTCGYCGVSLDLGDHHWGCDDMWEAEATRDKTIKAVAWPPFI